MIKYMTGDMLTTKVDAFCNPVNAVGVMGAGLALQFKLRWPDYYRAYQKQCKDGLFAPGDVTYHHIGNNQTVLSCFTKGHWRNPSTLGWVESCIKLIPPILLHVGAKSVAVPPLGCGLGGLDWETISLKMLEVFREYPQLGFFIYPPKESACGK